MKHSQLNSCALTLSAQDTGRPQQQWVHLLPAGRFSGRDGRGPYVVKDAPAIIEASRRHAGKTQLPIDYDHQSDFSAVPGVGGTAPAAGWITALQIRTDGIWGLVEWTERAAAQLGAREYRYLSPVFRHTPEGDVKAIIRAALTNSPNLDLTAVAAAGDTMEDDDLDELRGLLGLTDDADIGAITEAVRQLLQSTNSATPDLSKFVPIGDFERVTIELNKLNKGVTVQMATREVSDQIERGRLPPFLKDWGIALCTTNKPAFDAFVERTGSGMMSLFREIVPGRYHEDPKRGDGLSETELAVCAALNLTPAEFHGKAKKV